MKEIPLTQGKVTLVDDEDYEWLRKWNFRFLNGYAVKTIHGKRIHMHSLIMNPPDDMVVDHINGDSLDNRKVNLRLCTPLENSFNRSINSLNTSGYKGVTFSKKLGKWKASVGGGSNKTHLGFFENIEEAARAYDEAAKLRYGTFARLNFPDEVTQAHNEVSENHRNGFVVPDLPAEIYKNNKSGYRGVWWNKDANKYQVKIQNKHIALCDDPLEAARVYDEVAKQRYGNRARLNFPNEDNSTLDLSQYINKKRSDNTTGYRGVSRGKGRRKYLAQTQALGYIGTFDDPVDAAKAYDEAAKKSYGKNARLNFPD